MVKSVSNQSLNRSSTPVRTLQDYSSRGTTPKMSVSSPSSDSSTSLSSSSESPSRETTPLRTKGATPKIVLRKTGTSSLKPNQFTQRSTNCDQTTITSARSWQNLSPENRQPSYSNLSRPESQRNSRTSVTKSSTSLEAPTIQIRSASAGSLSGNARRQTCTYKEEPLPPIFTIFD